MSMLAYVFIVSAFGAGWIGGLLTAHWCSREDLKNAFNAGREGRPWWEAVAEYREGRKKRPVIEL